MHSSSKPWGPWSSHPIMVFEPWFLERHDDPCSGVGYGKFMHISWNDRICDHVQDYMFPPFSNRDNEYGVAYGPYQITKYSRGQEGRWTRIYFTMSTWNPYQVMLMTGVVRNDLA